MNRFSLVFISTIFYCNAAFSQVFISFDGSGLREGDEVTTQFKGVIVEGGVLAQPEFPLYAFWNDEMDIVDRVSNTQSPFGGPFLTDDFVNGKFNFPQSISIEFTQVATQISFWMADIDFGEIYTIDAFGVNEKHIGTLLISDQDSGTGDVVATRIDLPFVCVKRIEIDGANPDGKSGFGIDALSYENPLFGDVNGDNVVDLLDVEPFVVVLVGNLFQVEADVNKDGLVNLLDVPVFVDLLTD